jgi:hypothetical protein
LVRNLVSIGAFGARKKMQHIVIPNEVRNPSGFGMQEQEGFPTRRSGFRMMLFCDAPQGAQQRAIPGLRNFLGLLNSDTGSKSGASKTSAASFIEIIDSLRT